ncbi:hypothetical protein ACOMHN_039865 [Nucella lapillus]
MAEKNVWMLVKRLDKSFSEGDKEAHLMSIQTVDGETMKQLSAKVRGLLQLEDSGFVLQLRNERGSLIPLNGKLEENTKETPYKLSVLTEYQTVSPKPRSIQADNYTSTVHNQTQMFLSRISNIENSIPELKVKREQKIKQEIRELEDKLNFLQKRFNEADQMEWMGGIKKSPLW